MASERHRLLIERAKFDSRIEEDGLVDRAPVAYRLESEGHKRAGSGLLERQQMVGPPTEEEASQDYV